MREKRPPLGSYTPDHYGHHPRKVGGVCTRFRKYRKKKMVQADRSRKINRR